MDLTKKIESLRLQMIELAMEKNKLCDERVVALSQQLDVYLVQYQKAQGFTAIG